MKTILLGYGDIHAKGKAVLLAGTDISTADQIKQISIAKTSGEYPKGIVRIDFCEVIARNVGISIEANSATLAASKKGEADRIAALKKADVGTQKNAALVAAQKKVSDAAIARNEKISAKATADEALKVAKAKLASDDSKENQAALKKAESEVAANVSEIETANKKFAAAEAELQAVKTKK